MSPLEAKVQALERALAYHASELAKLRGAESEDLQAEAQATRSKAPQMLIPGSRSIRNPPSVPDVRRLGGVPQMQILLRCAMLVLPGSDAGSILCTSSGEGAGGDRRFRIPSETGPAVRTAVPIRWLVKSAERSI
jgi:hypothetical protein